MKGIKEDEWGGRGTIGQGDEIDRGKRDCWRREGKGKHRTRKGKKGKRRRGKGATDTKTRKRRRKGHRIKKKKGAQVTPK